MSITASEIARGNQAYQSQAVARVWDDDGLERGCLWEYLSTSSRERGQLGDTGREAIPSAEGEVPL